MEQRRSQRIANRSARAEETKVSTPPPAPTPGPQPPSPAEPVSGSTAVTRSRSREAKTRHRSPDSRKQPESPGLSPPPFGSWTDGKMGVMALRNPFHSENNAVAAAIAKKIWYKNRFDALKAIIQAPGKAPVYRHERKGSVYTLMLSREARLKKLAAKRMTLLALERKGDLDYMTSAKARARDEVEACLAVEMERKEECEAARVKMVADNSRAQEEIASLKAQLKKLRRGIGQNKAAPGKGFMAVNILRSRERLGKPKAKAAAKKRAAVADRGTRRSTRAAARAATSSKVAPISPNPVAPVSPGPLGTTPSRPSVIEFVGPPVGKGAKLPSGLWPWPAEPMTRSRGRKSAMMLL